MKPVEFAQQIIETLQRSTQSIKYYEKDIEWFQKKIYLWQGDYLRVGMIGITSTGKSTLLNALLGEDLLPTAVRPTSGITITCAKGSVMQAVIHYAGRKKKDIIKGKEIGKVLKKLGDERYNPNNKKGVEYLEIKSPEFPFADNVQIVDSPGLGAADMGHHELLTLESLLPSLHACIYLTTMKANSDQEVKENLAVISKHKDIRILIAQNMLDSVCPKLGKDGIVLKDEQQVAEEHEVRLKRIVDKLSQKQISIVQVSAKQALKGRIAKDENLLRESQYKEFLHTTQHLVDQALPGREGKNINDMVKNLDLILGQEETALKKEQGSLSEIKQDTTLPNVHSIRKGKEKMQKDIAAELNKMKSFYEQTFAKIQNMDIEKFKQAEQSCSAAVKRSKETNDKINECYQTFLQNTNHIFEQMNLDPQQYLRGSLPLRRVENMPSSVPRRTETRTEWRKKRGILNGTKRFFGEIFGTDWGWESHETSYQVIDKQRALTRLKKNIEDQEKAVSIFLEKVTKQAEQADQMLQQEIVRRKEAKALKEQISLGVKERKEMISALKKIRKQLDGSKTKKVLDDQKKKSPVHGSQQQEKRPAPVSQKQSSKQEQKHNHQHKKRNALEVEPYFLYMVNLAHRIKTRHFTVIFSKSQELSLAHTGKSFHGTLLWSWDSSDLSLFCSRFLGWELNNEQKNNLLSRGHAQGMHDSKPVFFIDEKNIQSEDEIIRLFPDAPLHIYLLVNAVQSGASQQHIRRSVLHKMLGARKDYALNWVSQSLAEFIEADNLDEWIEAMFTLRKELKEQSPGFILVNDQNPVYSLLMLELHLKKQAHLNVEVKLNNLLYKSVPYLATSSVLKRCSSITKSYHRLQEKHQVV